MLSIGDLCFCVSFQAWTPSTESFLIFLPKDGGNKNWTRQSFRYLWSHILIVGRIFFFFPARYYFGGGRVYHKFLPFFFFQCYLDPGLGPG